MSLTADGRRHEVIRGLGRRLNIRRLTQIIADLALELRLRRCAMQAVVAVTMSRTNHGFDPSVDFGLGSSRTSYGWNPPLLGLHPPLASIDRQPKSA